MYMIIEVCIYIYIFITQMYMCLLYIDNSSLFVDMGNQGNQGNQG